MGVVIEARAKRPGGPARIRGAGTHTCMNVCKALCVVRCDGNIFAFSVVLVVRFERCIRHQ
jgi:hypothetical protein